MTGSIGVLETAIYDRLRLDATIQSLLGGQKVYNRIAPTDTALPYIIFQWQGGGEKNLTPTRMRVLYYTIKALSLSDVEADNIDERIEALLHDYQLTVSGWTNFWTSRELDIIYSEVDAAGITVHHIGAQYKIMLGK